ncbi:hypothetical protein PENPOL_c009G09158 [Penicillium polonicum]|uniref:Uncharacterized protein n=1 Tax=Penicillium polonicum TaxID=60169 RepID=A0A1V6NFG1_PENPO|nr:hypothetical protein PENPOL_c009G09158 [Penicillium polonicum]
MSFLPRVTGGAALRTRSDDSSDDFELWMEASFLWIIAGLALIAGIVVGIVYLHRKIDICDCLCFIICSPAILMKCVFEKLYRLIVLKAAPREQQTIPDYQDCLSPEEPLPVYKP